MITNIEANIKLQMNQATEVLASKRVVNSRIKRRPVMSSIKYLLSFGKKFNRIEFDESRGC